MADLDFSRCRLPPFAHQREDVEWLMGRPYALIASEMRTGKSKICVDAAQFLFEAGVIDKVIIVAPAPVRDVWADQTLGELAKHLWIDTRATVTEFHTRLRTWVHGPIDGRERTLDFYVTNFEFLRAKNRLTQLLPACGPKTLLIGDESSFLKNHNAQQTKAFAQLRRACGRVILLNGTPIFHSPLDLFSQGNILHPSILECKFVTQFKARYAIETPVRGAGGKPLINNYGKAILEISGWANLDDLERRLAPYTVRRLQAECLDLPPKLDPVTLTATLDTSWPHYKDMRDDLVVWLTQSTVATSATAAIKALRLSQITGGFLGGVEEAGIEPVDNGLLESLDLNGAYSRPILADVYDLVGTLEKDKTDYTFEDIARAQQARPEGAKASDKLDMRSFDGVAEVGREKLDVLLWFIKQRLEADSNLHLVAWSRFRAECLRAEREVKERFPQFETAVIMGGQKNEDRLRALALLKPETAPKGPVFVAGIEGTGSFGLDMTAAHTCVMMSSGYSPGRFAQTRDRVYGPGQTQPIAYFNIVAVGPKGQKTIDHDILATRLSGEQIATRTAAAWVKALKGE